MLYRLYRYGNNKLADMLADPIIDTPLTECMDIMSVDQTQANSTGA